MESMFFGVSMRQFLFFVLACGVAVCLSPGDELGIDALFQALTYACYYKSSADYENERKDSDITVIFVRREERQTGIAESK